MKQETTKTELRITQQRRVRDAMECDLAVGAARMTVAVAPSVDDGWRVATAVRRNVGDEPLRAAETGASKTDAFREVARKWTEGSSWPGGTAFDWPAVEALLVGVRVL